MLSSPYGLPWREHHLTAWNHSPYCPYSRPASSFSPHWWATAQLQALSAGGRASLALRFTCTVPQKTNRSPHRTKSGFCTPTYGASQASLTYASAGSETKVLLHYFSHQGRNLSERLLRRNKNSPPESLIQHLGLVNRTTEPRRRIWPQRRIYLPISPV
ncbi:hypothetical protein M8818_005863 [Zalaria obscura]|uniref:Uncharacterized protein n=1 Tax=Zalaria obscura TaxID=2024903 RepID=A0ACC3S895_9PEZI